MVMFFYPLAMITLHRCRICALGMEELPTDREVPIFACRNEAVFEQLKADCGFTR